MGQIKIPVDVSEYDIHTNDIGRFNTKIKRYRDGSCTVIYSDANIFMPENQISLDDEDAERANKIWVGKMLSKERKLELAKWRTYYEELACNGTLEEKSDEFQKYVKKWLEDDKRLQKENSERSRNDSMKRAIDKVYDIAFQNDWKYFFTGTLNEDNDFDRCDPKEIIKPFNKWLNNRVNRKGLQYIIIPEVHPEKGEGIHFHGLMNDALDMVDSGRVLFKDGRAWKRDDVRRLGQDPDNYRTIYNVADWRYGFSTAIPLEGSPAKIASYITKYITKDVKKLFGRFYYSSRNIEKTADMIFLHTDKAAYEDCPADEVRKFGVGLKYKSDFLMKEGSERDPTAELLKCLDERGYIK